MCAEAACTSDTHGKSDYYPKYIAKTPSVKSWYMADIKQKTISKKHGKITLDNTTEFTYRNGVLEGYNFETVRRNYNVVVETYVGNFYWMYGMIKGPEEERKNALAFLMWIHDDVRELSDSWCTICYQDGHISIECTNCVACGSPEHKLARCDKFEPDGYTRDEMETKRPQPLMQTRQQRANYKKRQRNYEASKAPHSNYHWYDYYNYKEVQGAKVVEEKGFGLHVEKGQCIDYANCSLVIISAYYHQSGVQVAYKAYVNRISHLTGTYYSNVLLPERRRGFSIEKVKADVLNILARHTVYTHTGLQDFQSLDISEDDLIKHLVVHKDLSMLSDCEAKHRNNRMEAASLSDMYWVYKGVAIQQYSKKFRVSREHSCEIDARSTLKLGKHLDNNQIEVIGCDEIREKVKKDIAAGILKDWSTITRAPYVFSKYKSKEN